MTLSYITESAPLGLNTHYMFGNTRDKDTTEKDECEAERADTFENEQGEKLDHVSK